MPQFITSNPALPGIQEAENRQIQLAQVRQQQAAATRQDETRRKLASFHATPTGSGPQSPSQQALSYAVNTPGAGEMAMRLAETQSKDQSDHEDNAMKLLINGDTQGASAYAQTHNVTSVLSLLEHPPLVQEITSFANLADKVRPKDSAYRFKFVQAGMEALPQIMGSTNPQTGRPYTHQEALPLVQAAAMKGAESVPLPLPGQARMIQDADGNWYAATTAGANPVGVRGAKPGAKGRGGATPAGNSIQRSFAGNDGNMYAILKQLDAQGNPVTKQLVDEKGNPIRSSDVSKFAGQVYLKTADQPGGGSIPDAQSVAGQLYPSPPPVVTRRYVPGKGFVSVP